MKCEGFLWMIHKYCEPIDWNGKHATCILKTADTDTWSVEMNTPIKSKVH